MPYITSCSIACGFHAGDPMVMFNTVKAAQRHSVRIGAHPSFLDLQGFGRREMKIDPLECEKMVIYQIGALKAFLDIEGIPLSHVSVRATPLHLFHFNFDLQLTRAFVAPRCTLRSHVQRRDHLRSRLPSFKAFPFEVGAAHSNDRGSKYIHGICMREDEYTVHSGVHRRSRVR